MWWTALALAAPAEITPERCEAAKAYHAAHEGVALLVRVDDVVVCEASSGAAYELASGTKSFSGLLALVLVQRGELSLDELVSDTLQEWAADPRKQKITVRQLLSLTSGLESKPLGRETWTEAIAAPVVAEPGTVFRYGSAPFQVFGALVQRKTGRDPVELLTEWVFDPIGLKVDRWLHTRDGHPTMPYGAKLSAQEWAKVGELVRHRGRWGEQQVLQAELMDELFHGSQVAPFYGLSWWLAPADLLRRRAPRKDPAVPDDLVMAAGLGDQRLYVSGGLHLVVVRQTDETLSALLERSGWSDTEFLRTLLAD
jgi:CubicO group peptidase (beta-lactamase class C family)